MGLLEDVVKNPGGVTEILSRNPALVAAAVSLLSSRRGSIGPADGLNGLARAFTANGLGDVISSWISTGPNRNVSGQQVAGALGEDTIGQFSEQAGVPRGQAGDVLAGLLPLIVDRLTPQGEAPEGPALEDGLGRLMRSFGAAR